LKEVVDSEKQKLIARAQKFGLHSKDMNEVKKKMRAEKFGVSQKSKEVKKDEKRTVILKPDENTIRKKMREERFGKVKGKGGVCITSK
jgi:hypothetical protein